MLLLLAALAALARAEPVVGYVDLHIHLAAHLAVPIYGDGPEGSAPDHFSHRHALKQQIFIDDLRGPTVLLSLAYANPMLTVFETRASMRKRMERQLDYVEGFAARHPDRFGLARSPEEARSIIGSGRIAIVQGIEGATKILREPGDAERWAARGVAVITPIHLADNEIGGSLCETGGGVVLNLPGCFGQWLRPSHQGLSRQGFASVHALIDAGIVIDMAHTSALSFEDMGGLLEKRGVSPLYTHATAQGVREDRTALSDAQLGAIYALGGLVGITAKKGGVAPKPRPEGLPTTHCENSIDDLRLHWDHLTAGASGAPVAWGSDFQGGITHIRPRYGPKGCADARPDGTPLDTFDLEGLSRPGLVDSMFEQLAAEGADRAPLDASAERFLQIWARARNASTLHPGPTREDLPPPPPESPLGG